MPQQSSRRLPWAYLIAGDDPVVRSQFGMLDPLLGSVDHAGHVGAAGVSEFQTSKVYDVIGSFRPGRDEELLNPSSMNVRDGGVEGDFESMEQELNEKEEAAHRSAMTEHDDHNILASNNNGRDSDETHVN